MFTHKLFTYFFFCINTNVLWTFQSLYSLSHIHFVFFFFNIIKLSLLGLWLSSWEFRTRITKATIISDFEYFRIASAERIREIILLHRYCTYYIIVILILIFRLPLKTVVIRIVTDPRRNCERRFFLEYIFLRSKKFPERRRVFHTKHLKRGVFFYRIIIFPYEKSCTRCTCIIIGN